MNKTKQIKSQLVPTLSLTKEGIIDFSKFNDMHHRIAIRNAYALLRKRTQWLNNHEAHVNLEQNRLKKLVAALQRGLSLINTAKNDNATIRLKVWGEDTTAECLVSLSGQKENTIVCYKPVNVEFLQKIIKR
ncbi:hypothetical protein MA9V1_129 [Chryseobacterium phage MA9V-1]|nr:hypothetical protein MA9V1_129 [Chryseobacterium phage MA9V-1]